MRSTVLDLELMLERERREAAERPELLAQLFFFLSWGMLDSGRSKNGDSLRNADADSRSPS